MAEQSTHGARATKDFPVRGIGFLLVVGIANLAVSYHHSFNLLLGIAILLSAGSFALGFWKPRAVWAGERVRGAAALTLSVWAVGLYGYATASTVGSALDRITAGIFGTLYVFVFVGEVPLLLSWLRDGE